MVQFVRLLTSTPVKMVDMVEDGPMPLSLKSSETLWVFLSFTLESQAYGSLEGG